MLTAITRRRFRRAPVSRSILRAASTAAAGASPVRAFAEHAGFVDAKRRAVPEPAFERLVGEVAVLRRRVEHQQQRRGRIFWAEESDAVVPVIDRREGHTDPASAGPRTRRTYVVIFGSSGGELGLPDRNVRRTLRQAHQRFGQKIPIDHPRATTASSTAKRPGAICASAGQPNPM